MQQKPVLLALANSGLHPELRLEKRRKKCDTKTPLGVEEAIDAAACRLGLFL